MKFRETSINANQTGFINLSKFEKLITELIRTLFRGKANKVSKGFPYRSKYGFSEKGRILVLPFLFACICLSFRAIMSAQMYLQRKVIYMGEIKRVKEYEYEYDGKKITRGKNGTGWKCGQNADGRTPIFKSVFDCKKIIDSWNGLSVSDVPIPIAFEDGERLNLKDQHIMLRVTKTEKQMIAERAKVLGLSISEYILTTVKEEMFLKT